MNTLDHTSHLIVGGQRSGKSRHAQDLAQRWLLSTPGGQVTVVATARVGDAEMAERIERHRQSRPQQFNTVEEPLYLASVVREWSAPQHLLLVDCLTLWLTNWLMPCTGAHDVSAWSRECEAMLQALAQAQGPVVCISNEVGWGVIPLASEVRRFVDELGRLNQAVANHCHWLTLMVAGQPWTQRVARQ